MGATIEEGRLTEAPTPGATGIERRAFGEFESRHGELASYAFGWSTDADPQVAHMTVGIGAGNEGGGTFHAIVFVDDDGYAFQLVDEPFETVPEGGPHLTADESRAHDTLPFIWLVCDTVMEQDRRAWWMLHWLHGTGAVQTPEITSGAEPVVFVVREDDEDESWKLIGRSDPGEDGDYAHLFHALDRDQTLLEILDLPPGWRATREDVGWPWFREPDEPAPSA